jgi:hypothetical protein
MKRFFKKAIRAIKELFIWATSREVLEGINSGASYEEVEQIVKNKEVKI